MVPGEEAAANVEDTVRRREDRASIGNLRLDAIRRRSIRSPLPYGAPRQGFPSSPSIDTSIYNAYSIDDASGAKNDTINASLDHAGEITQSQLIGGASMAISIDTVVPNATLDEVAQSQVLPSPNGSSDTAKRPLAKHRSAFPGDFSAFNSHATAKRTAQAEQILEKLYRNTFSLQEHGNCPVTLINALSTANITPKDTFTAKHAADYIHIMKARAAIQKIPHLPPNLSATTATLMTTTYMKPLMRYLQALQSYLAANPYIRREILNSNTSVNSIFNIANNRSRMSSLNTLIVSDAVTINGRPPSPELPFNRNLEQNKYDDVLNTTNEQGQESRTLHSTFDLQKMQLAQSQMNATKNVQQKPNYFFFATQIPMKRYKNNEHQNRHQSVFLFWVSILQTLVLIGTLVYAGFAPVSLNFLLGPPFSVFYEIGGNVPLLIKENFNVNGWRLISPIIYHGGILHLLMNVHTQISMGRNMEQAWSGTRIAAIYFLSSIGGNLCSAVVRQRNIVTVGASGGVLGLFGAIFADSIINHDSIWYPRAQAIYWGVNCLITLLSGLAPIVDNIVHVGGFMIGFFSGLMFIPTLSKNWRRRVICFVLGLIGTVTIFATGLWILVYRPSYNCTPVCCYLFLSLKC